MEIRRTIPVLGLRHLKLSSRAAFIDSFAQRIMEKYHLENEDRLPSASFVYYQPFWQGDEQGKLAWLAQALLTLNRFSSLSIRHSYEFRYYTMLRMQCEQLFSSFYLNPFQNHVLGELRQTYQTVLSRFDRVVPEEKGEIQRIREQKEQERTEQVLLKVQKQIGGVPAFFVLDRGTRKAEVPEQNPRTVYPGNIFLPAKRLRPGMGFIWKSEQAKRFFWRVQRASFSERELILNALDVRTLSGLMSMLKQVKEEKWEDISRQIQDRIRLYLEDRESIDRTDADKRVSRRRGLADRGAVGAIEREAVVRYLYLMDTGWYQSVMEAVSYLNLEEWQGLKREILLWIPEKYRGERTGVYLEVGGKGTVGPVVYSETGGKGTVGPVVYSEAGGRGTVRPVVYPEAGGKEEVRPVVYPEPGGRGTVRPVVYPEAVSKDVVRPAVYPVSEGQEEVRSVVYPMSVGQKVGESAVYPEAGGKGTVSFVAYLEPVGERAVSATAYPEPVDKGMVSAAVHSEPVRQGSVSSVVSSEPVGQGTVSAAAYPEAVSKGTVSASVYPEPVGKGVGSSAAYPEPGGEESGKPAVYQEHVEMETEKSAIYQMSEEKRALFERLNLQKEKLETILQYGTLKTGSRVEIGSAAIDLIEEALVFRQYFKKSRVLSQYIHWKEEEQTDSLKKILEQMPETEWSRLQTEFQTEWPVAWEGDLFWDLRKAVLNQERTELISLLAEYKTEEGTQDFIREPHVLIDMIQEGIRRTEIRKEQTGWYQSVMEAISYLDRKEWDALKTEIISADPMLFYGERDKIRLPVERMQKDIPEGITFASLPEQDPMWKEKQTLIFSLEKKSKAIWEAPWARISRQRADGFSKTMGQVSMAETENESKWEDVIRNSQILVPYIEQTKELVDRQIQVFREQTKKTEAATLGFSEKTGQEVWRESIKNRLLHMEERDWKCFCQEMGSLLEKNFNIFERSIKEGENSASEKFTGRQVKHLRAVIRLLQKEEEQQDEKRFTITGREKTGEKFTESLAMRIGEKEKEEFIRKIPVLRWLEEERQDTILFCPIGNVRGKSFMTLTVPQGWTGEEKGVQAALKVMEQQREKRTFIRKQIFFGDEALFQKQLLFRDEVSAQNETFLRKSQKSAPEPPSYDPASLVIVQRQQARKDSGPALAPQVRREIRTETARQVQEQTDIRFVTRTDHTVRQGQTAFQAELESMTEQLEQQKQQLEELKQQQAARQEQDVSDASQLSKAVMKKLQGQLRQEQLRHGL